MAFIRRWWGWTVFVALLVGVGVALHAVLPPAPRLRIDGALGVAVSDDGATLYTVDASQEGRSLGGPVRVWDTRSGRLLRTTGADLKINSRGRPAFSPDLAWLVSFPDWDTVKAFNLRDGSEVKVDLETIAQKTAKKPFKGDGFRAEFHGQSRFVFMRFDNTLLAVVDLSTGRLVHQAVANFYGGIGVAGAAPVYLYRGPDDEVCAVDLEKGTVKKLPPSYSFLSISGDGSLIATGRVGTWDQAVEVQIRDAATLEVKQCLPNLEALAEAFRKQEIYTFAATFSPDNRVLAVYGPNQTLEMWDTDTGKRRFTLPGEYAFWFSPDSRWIAVRDPAHRNRTNFFNLQTGERQGEIDSPPMNAHRNLRFLSDRMVLFREFRDVSDFSFPVEVAGRLDVIALQPQQKGSEFASVVFSVTPNLHRDDLWLNLQLSSPPRALAVTCSSRHDTWIDRIRQKWKDWIPAPIDYSELAAIDLHTGQRLGSTRQEGGIVGFFAADGSTLVAISNFESAEPAFTCVWDVPFGRPWRWIVGVPLALGAALLGVRAAWRRWRAKRGGTAAGNASPPGA